MTLHLYLPRGDRETEKSTKKKKKSDDGEIISGNFPEENVEAEPTREREERRYVFQILFL